VRPAMRRLIFSSFSLASATAGLYRTVQRERIGTIRQNGVEQTSSSVFLEQDVRLTDFLRVTGGLRYDYFDFDVNSTVAANSGKANDGIASPKLPVVVGPFAKTELDGQRHHLFLREPAARRSCARRRPPFPPR
jgi:outer membrane receptor protein involved in Fe transport